MTDAIRWFIASVLAVFTLISLALTLLPGFFLYRKRHRKYRYFVFYRIFNNGIEERGGHCIVQSQQSPSEIDNVMFAFISEAMGVKWPLEIQFTGCSRLV